jgi:pimeloyl-ACP methyl ester carboxylesterase
VLRASFDKACAQLNPTRGDHPKENTLSKEADVYESLRSMDMRFVYRRAGIGKVPIVLLHGWPQTSKAWLRLVPFLSSRCDRPMNDSAISHSSRTIADEQRA